MSESTGQSTPRRRTRKPAVWPRVILLPDSRTPEQREMAKSKFWDAILGPGMPTEEQAADRKPA